MKSERVSFENQEGQKLAGRLQLPVDKKARHFAIFAHCFTCGKDLRSVRNLTLALSQQGFGVLRFDFTGLGQSGGDFAETNFSSNVNDIRAAADFLAENYSAPRLLIGHSLGGTAVLMAGSKMDSVEAIVTIGAPCDPAHVLKLVEDKLGQISETGEASVTIAGRSFNIKNQFVKDLENRGMATLLGNMRKKALLVMHSPQDEVVEISNARSIYESAHHPKSFITLDGADHLLSDERDSSYAGEVIGAWVSRYLPQPETDVQQSDEQVLARLSEGPFLTEILAGPHHLLADEPKDVGGGNLGPTPYEFLAAGLGACTAMTLRMYADRKKWKLEEVNVHLNYDSKYKDDCVQCEEESSKIGRFERLIEMKGDLDEKQVERLLQIADKCPVHKTLASGVNIHTRLKE